MINNRNAKRITFAIISHPDAGKTTLTMDFHCDNSGNATATEINF